MKLILNIRVSAIHVNPVIFDAIKLLGIAEPMTDALTGEIDNDMLTMDGNILLRDDSVETISVDIQQSVVEVGDEQRSG